ncbi:MAG: triose-phosphate isomerase [Bacteroidia bacterium]|nr:triose-phosphate isomerase [Bacteroidia bacterium]
MERKKIVAANWKMNTLHAEAITLAKDILTMTRLVKEVEKIIFPPFPFINDVALLLQSETGFSTGAQNCSAYEKGAYTGEVSCAMIHSVGAEYVLIGHSERRAYFKEDAEVLVAKVHRALAQHLKVVYCFGEVLNERKAGQHQAVVKKQLQEVISQVPKEKMNQLILAYEPVWAIGTGETASPAQAQNMHAFVRQCLAELVDTETATSMPVLYGGSCNAQNAKELFACPDVDGGLIGGASLKPQEFASIVKAFQ